MTDWGSYTPGPWVANWDTDTGGPYDQWVVRSHGVKDGVEIAYIALVDDQSEADARLISKAYLVPRLEAALDEMWDWHVERCEVCGNPPRGVRGCPIWLRLEEVLAELGSGL